MRKWEVRQRGRFFGQQGRCRRHRTGFGFGFSFGGGEGFACEVGQDAVAALMLSLYEFRLGVARVERSAVAVGGRRSG